jgi:hypothetical protein
LHQRHAHNSLPRKCRRAQRTAAVQTEANTDTEEEYQIEGVDRNYCDDFVCNSSPAVEQNLRALARDLTRLNTWTLSLFSTDVRYKDKYLSFSGTAPYMRRSYFATAVKDAKVLVTKLRMLNKDTGEIQYRLRGSIWGLPVDIDFWSDFELNLLTGRVLRHEERWDLQRCSLPAKLAFSITRTLWSGQQRSEDVKDGGKKVLQSLSSIDEDDGKFSANPTDPTRFFQQQDNKFNDSVQIALIMAVLYFIFQAYAQIEQIK